MEYESTRKIQGQLSSGESLIWSGRPKQGVILRGSDIFLIPFSILWAAFAVFWEYTAYTAGAPVFFLVFGGAFVLMGIYFVFGRFIIDSLIRRRTYYGLTGNRVLIVTEFPSVKTKSLILSTLSDVTYTSNSDHSGSITFGPQHPMASIFGGMQWPGTGAYQGPQFDMIENVKSVYDILQDTIRNRESRA